MLEVTSTGVGIGTASPGATLDVQIASNTLGTRIQNDSATTARLLAMSAGNAGWTGGNGIAQFTVGNSSATGRVISIINHGIGDSLKIEHLGASGSGLIVTGGKVGFGTTAPTAPFHVKGGPAGGSAVPQLVQRIESDVVVMGDGPKVEFGWSSNTGAAIWAHGIATHQADLVFGTNNGSATTGEVMRLKSSGNVGIGTTNPKEKLTLLGGAFSFMNPANPGWGSVVGFDYDSTTDALRIRANVSTEVLNTTHMTVKRETGYVGIGTTSPSHKLQVSGTVRATSFISDTTTYADFVFKPDYRLRPLAEVEAHIQAKGHLPDIPSEVEAKRDGIDLARMQVKLLQKVEELTLYLIDLKKENAALRKEVEQLKSTSAL